MKPWQLLVAPAAERSLSRLPEGVATAIVEFILGPLLDEPRRVGKPLQRELADYWSARRGRLPRRLPARQGIGHRAGRADRTSSRRLPLTLTSHRARQPAPPTGPIGHALVRQLVQNRRSLTRPEVPYRSAGPIDLRGERAVVGHADHRHRPGGTHRGSHRQDGAFRWPSAGMLKWPWHPRRDKLASGRRRRGHGLRLMRAWRRGVPRSTHRSAATPASDPMVPPRAGVIRRIGVKENSLRWSQ